MSSPPRQEKRKTRARDLAEDKFLEQGRSWSAWLEARIAWVLAGLAGVLVLVLVVQYFAASDKRGAALVTAELRSAVQSFEQATDFRAVMTATSADVLHRGYESALKKLQAFAAEHRDHGSARLARLYAADLERRLGRPEEAERDYRIYVDGAAKDDVLLEFAHEGLGYALEAQGKDEEALKLFQRLVDGPKFYREQGLKHTARLFEKKGDIAAAVAAYQAIVDIEPPSDLRAYAEARLKALK